MCEREKEREGGGMKRSRKEREGIGGEGNKSKY